MIWNRVTKKSWVSSWSLWSNTGPDGYATAGLLQAKKSRLAHAVYTQNAASNLRALLIHSITVIAR